MSFTTYLYSTDHRAVLDCDKSDWLWSLQGYEVQSGAIIDADTVAAMALSGSGFRDGGSRPGVVAWLRDRGPCVLASEYADLPWETEPGWSRFRLRPRDPDHYEPDPEPL